MRAPRAPRPAPRTLAAPPPSAPLRTPRATGYEARFPALAVVLASGVVLPACHDPECGSTRSDELERHGADGLREAGRGRASSALRELGVAIGVVAHDRTTVPEVRAAGAIAPVQPNPPPVAPIEEPGVARGGAEAVVSPTPPPMPPPTPPHQRTTPNAADPRPAQPGARRPVTPTVPTPSAPTLGGDMSVSPLPIERGITRG
jgi:hypothetical protein